MEGLKHSSSEEQGTHSPDDTLQVSWPQVVRWEAKVQDGAAEEAARIKLGIENDKVVVRRRKTINNDADDRNILVDIIF